MQRAKNYISNWLASVKLARIPRWTVRPDGKVFWYYYVRNNQVRQRWATWEQALLYQQSVIKWQNDNRAANFKRIGQWRKKNKDKVASYAKKKRDTCTLTRIKGRLRARTVAAFKAKSWHKSGPTEKLLGCTWSQAHQHIEKQFLVGMNWDNHGDWHIDHIVPLAAAKDAEELSKLCHYSNLQPLWAKDNLKKHAKFKP